MSGDRVGRDEEFPADLVIGQAAREHLEYDELAGETLTPGSWTLFDSSPTDSGALCLLYNRKREA